MDGGELAGGGDEVRLGIMHLVHEDCDLFGDLDDVRADFNDGAGKQLLLVREVLLERSNPALSLAKVRGRKA